MIGDQQPFVYRGATLWFISIKMGIKIIIAHVSPKDGVKVVVGPSQ